MSGYSFTELSPLDFEILTRDLLQKEMQITLESFKPGRDGGIDLRCLTELNKTLIVQCKHYVGSGFNLLISDIKNKEVPKIQKLQPNRYILVTSVALTPQNKKDLQGLLAPFCLSVSDIYGKDDLNNLLGKFPEIERLHLKLWLSSTTVLETIVHSQVINTSAEELDKIKRRSRLYVQNDSLAEALQILNTYNFCIIAGIPGIGKTTLAEIIVLYHLRNGYELVRITSNIQEARSLGLGRSKRIYYYDDFLGQASDADKLAKNEDQSLLDFFEAIRNSKLSKLVLTTREYILNQARLRYEKLARVSLNLETCVVDLQKYTRLNRAEILFNHLYFSDLPKDFKAAILAETGYLKIIDHPNYSPRFIDLLTKLSNVVGLPPNEYLGFFLGKLSNPAELWEHAFLRQLGEGAKNILVLLTSMPRKVLLDDLRFAFQSYHAARCRFYSSSNSPSAFMDGCRELEGNFLTYSKSEERISVTFHNPSIRDFVQSYCAGAQDDMLLLLENAVFFEQLLWLADFKLPKSSVRVFDSFIASHADAFAVSLERTLLAQSCLTEPSWGVRSGRWSESTIRSEVSLESRFQSIAELYQRLKAKAIGELVEKCCIQILERCRNGSANRQDLTDLIEWISSDDVELKLNKELLEGARNLLTKNLKQVEHFRYLSQLASVRPDFITRQVIDDFKVFTVDGLDTWIYGTASEDPDEIRACAQTVKELAAFMGLDVSAKLTALDETADEKETQADHNRVDPDDDRGAHSYGIEGTNEEIASLFETLPLI